MSDYAYGYCGMPCALCTRYRTDGKSRCPGCSHDGYYTEPCKVYRCCKEKNMKQCGLCKDFICSKLGKMGDFSDLNTNNAKKRNSDCIAAEGFEHWYKEYKERADLLTTALERYNNGRMKRFMCELFIQQDIETLRMIMHQAETLTGTQKEIGKKFQVIVQSVLGK